MPGMRLRRRAKQPTVRIRHLPQSIPEAACKRPTRIRLMLAVSDSEAPRVRTDGLIAVQRAGSVCRGLGRAPARAALLP